MRIGAFLVPTLLLSVAPFASADESAGKGPHVVAYMPAGFSFGSPHTAGTAIGGTLSWDVDSTLSLQGSASGLVRGRGANGLSLTAEVLARFGPTEMKARPYVVAGLGLYRASFDMDDPRFRGPASPMGEPTFGEMPGFYASRMNGIPVGEPPDRRSFIDPAVTGGAGVSADLGPKLSFRAEARAIAVLTRHDHQTLGLVTIALGYRF
jgi:outer membrane protein with beta-barrel domain